MNDVPPPAPTQLHKLICAKCQKPITKGQSHRPEIRTPTGTVAVHEACFDGGKQSL